MHPLNGTLAAPYVPVRLHVVLWLHNGIPIRRAEPRSTTEFLFSSMSPSGTILLTPYSMVWDLQVSRAGPMLFYLPKLLCIYDSLLLFFPFSSSCLYIGWYCGAGVFGLIGCISLSLSQLFNADLFNGNE